jgi:hypothetical protein
MVLRVFTSLADFDRIFGSVRRCRWLLQRM